MSDYLFPIVSLIVILSTILFLGGQHLTPMSTGSSNASKKGDSTESTVRYTSTLLEGTPDKPRILKLSAEEQGISQRWQPMSARRWLEVVTQPTTAQATQSLIDILANTKMNAYFFETKGISYTNSLNKSFEFVLVETDYLYDFADGNHDADTFAEHLETIPIDGVGCVFTNLGGDSLLIAPKQIASGTNVYGHLAAFSRRAPQDQQLQFWALSANSLLNKLKEDDNKTWWFSTDGTGVGWLHMRIDPHPKYYDYEPFGNESRFLDPLPADVEGDDGSVVSGLSDGSVRD